MTTTTKTTTSEPKQEEPNENKFTTKHRSTVPQPARQPRRRPRKPTLQVTIDNTDQQQESTFGTKQKPMVNAIGHTVLAVPSGASRTDISDAIARATAPHNQRK